MPHNNRVSTSGALRTTDIWSRTIGHDPHAPDGDVDVPNERRGRAGGGGDRLAATDEHARGLMELVKHQVVANSNGRGAGSAGSGPSSSQADGFSARMFHGLKKRPQWEIGGKSATTTASASTPTIGEDLRYESSSEDEYIDVRVPARSTKDSEQRGNIGKKDEREGGDEKKKSKKRHKKKMSSKRSKKYDSESDDNIRKRRDRERRKRRRRTYSRSRSRSKSPSSSSSEQSSLSSGKAERKRRRRHKRSSRDERDKKNRKKKLKDRD